MARPPNTDIFQPGEFYHLYNHAVGNENLFRNRDNYLYFLQRFRYYISDVGACFAYCLMPNHFHFLIQIKPSEAIDHFWKLYRPVDMEHPGYHPIVMNQFSRMLNGYTQAYNKMFSRKGALFLDYIKRKQVTEQAYLTNLISYIHYNPVHHGFCLNIADWEFSSYRSLSGPGATTVERKATLALFKDKILFERCHLDNQRHAGILEEFEF